MVSDMFVGVRGDRLSRVLLTPYAKPHVKKSEVTRANANTHSLRVSSVPRGAVWHLFLRMVGSTYRSSQQVPWRGCEGHRSTRPRINTPRCVGPQKCAGHRDTMPKCSWLASS